MPDYSHVLTTAEDLVWFQTGMRAQQIWVPKIYLLSSKQTAPPVFAGLTAYYRDKVDFAFI